MPKFGTLLLIRSLVKRSSFRKKNKEIITKFLVVRR